MDMMGLSTLPKMMMPAGDSTLLAGRPGGASTRPTGLSSVGLDTRPTSLYSQEVSTKNSSDPPQSPATPTAEPAPSVAERILSTATDLFYREGVRAVGIQRVIDEAGIAKASLYAHYASKDDLVAACIRKHGETAHACVDGRLAAAPDARSKLLALFDIQVDLASREDYRGCPFQNAASEIADPNHPAKAATADVRQWIRGLIGGLVKEAGLESPEEVAGTLLVLYDGAAATSLVDANPAAARHARWAAERLIDAHLPARSRTA
jgi:AcrR family transcriptional regulator